MACFQGSSLEIQGFLAAKLARNECYSGVSVPRPIIPSLYAAISVLVFHHPTELINSASVPWKHCGNSPVEALQNDCVYDFIAGAFVPNACFDAELEDEFLKLKDWHFYGDENAQQELSIESIKLNGGTEPMFVSVEYHWIHCTYTWRKLHRSRVFGTPIDDHIGNYSHTAHCGEGLVSQCDVNDTGPIIAFLHHYTSCLA
jgi:hypothetical protein